MPVVVSGSRWVVRVMDLFLYNATPAVPITLNYALRVPLLQISRAHMCLECKYMCRGSCIMRACHDPRLTKVPKQLPPYVAYAHLHTVVSFPDPMHPPCTEGKKVSGVI